MRWTWLTVLALACGSGTIGDSEGTDSTDMTDVTDDTDVQPEPSVFTESGDASASTDTGSLAIDGRCTLNWTRYRPDGEPGEVLVILVHGFSRSQAQMAGWATHMATWGAEVVTPDMCFLRAFSTDHPANGAHVAALAEEMSDGRPVVLAGYSAGGLAAVLGASQTDNVGVLLLDPVDNNDLGANAMGSIPSPVGGLFADASRCNADSNGIAMAGLASDSRLWRLDGANHCHFESPTDRVCQTLCGQVEAGDAPMTETIQGLAAAFVSWRGGLDASGEEWWTEGTEANGSLPATLSALP
ncbi:MAG: alpha/beta hydrolase [Myxococcota bacterium]